MATARANRYPDAGGWSSQDDESPSWETLRNRDRQSRWLWVLVVLSTVVVLALRWPLVGSYPSNPDAANFVLAAREFDLRLHQPHPPGYPLFVAAGAVLTPIVADPFLPFAVLAWLFGGLAILPLYALGRRLVGIRAAILGVIVYVFSPLVWYYGLVGLTYGVEGFFALVVAWQLWRAREGQPWALTLAAVGLAIAGGIRPSTVQFLLPAGLLAAWRVPNRERIIATLVLAVGTVLWLVPLILLSGGPETFLRVNRELGQVVSLQTSFSGGLAAISGNLGQTVFTLVIGLQLGLVVLPAVLILRQRGRRGFSSARVGSHRYSLDELSVLGPRLLPKDAIVFLALLILPALAFFSFVHLGQPGYQILILGPLALVVGRSAEWLAVRLAVGHSISTRATRIAIASLIAAGGTLLFYQGDGLLSARSLVHDRQSWTALARSIEERPREAVLVLTGVWVTNPFRTAQVVFPDYQIHGVGPQPDGTWASLFHNEGGRISMTVSDIWREGPQFEPIPLTPAIQRVVIVDSKALQAVLDTPELRAVGPIIPMSVDGLPAYWIMDRP